jgi:hypothetical protein
MWAKSRCGKIMGVVSQEMIIMAELETIRMAKEKDLSP